MTQRQSPMAKSVFYRGISLKQYLRQSTEIYKQLQFKEEQTIFLDQDQRPIQISDNFIQRQKAQKLSLSHRYQRNPITQQQIHLPQITPRKPLYNKKNSLKSERFSTDVSLPLGQEARKGESAILKHKNRQRQHMKCQPAQSRCSSSRQTPFFLSQDSNIFNDSRPTAPPTPIKGRNFSNRRNAQLLKKQIQFKQRYNIIDRQPMKNRNKALCFVRAKSQLQ